MSASKFNEWIEPDWRRNSGDKERPPTDGGGRIDFSCPVGQQSYERERKKMPEVMGRQRLREVSIDSG